MQSEYLLHEYVGNIYCFAIQFDGNEVSGLAQIVHHYHDGIILPGLFWKTSDEIHGDGLPFPFRNW
jgi:hypothetical protein